MYDSRLMSRSLSTREITERRLLLIPFYMRINNVGIRAVLMSKSLAKEIKGNSVTEVTIEGICFSLSFTFSRKVLLHFFSSNFYLLPSSDVAHSSLCLFSPACK